MSAIKKFYRHLNALEEYTESSLQATLTDFRNLHKQCLKTAMTSVHISELTKCFDRHLDLLCRYYLSHDRSTEVQFICETMSIVENFVTNSYRDEFVCQLLSPMLERVIEPSQDIFIGKMLLKTLNNILLGSDTRYRTEFVEKNLIICCKLCDIICSCGDYMYQTVLLETLFRLCNDACLKQYSKDLFPEADALQAHIIEIDRNYFDRDCRIFLNALNQIFRNVYSVEADYVILETDTITRKLTASKELDGKRSNETIWVDFNKKVKSISVYFTADSTEVFSEDLCAPNEDWESIVIHNNNIKSFNYKKEERMKKTIKCTYYILTFVLKNELDTTLEDCQTAKTLIIFLTSKEIVKKLITSILPTMFNTAYFDNELLSSQDTELKKSPKRKMPMTYDELGLRFKKKKTRSLATSSKTKFAPILFGSPNNKLYGYEMQNNNGNFKQNLKSGMDPFNSSTNSMFSNVNSVPPTDHANNCDKLPKIQVLQNICLSKGTVFCYISSTRNLKKQLSGPECEVLNCNEHSMSLLDYENIQQKSNNNIASTVNISTKSQIMNENKQNSEVEGTDFAEDVVAKNSETDPCNDINLRSNSNVAKYKTLNFANNDAEERGKDIEDDWQENNEFNFFCCRNTIKEIPEENNTLPNLNILSTNQLNDTFAQSKLNNDLDTDNVDEVSDMEQGGNVHNSSSSETENLELPEVNLIEECRKANNDKETHVKLESDSDETDSRIYDNDTLRISSQKVASQSSITKNKVIHNSLDEFDKNAPHDTNDYNQTNENQFELLRQQMYNNYLIGLPIVLVERCDDNSTLQKESMFDYNMSEDIEIRSLAQSLADSVNKSSPKNTDAFDLQKLNEFEHNSILENKEEEPLAPNLNESAWTGPTTLVITATIEEHPKQFQSKDTINERNNSKVKILGNIELNKMQFKNDEKHSNSTNKKSEAIFSNLDEIIEYDSYIKNLNISSKSDNKQQRRKLHCLDDFSYLEEENLNNEDSLKSINNNSEGAKKQPNYVKENSESLKPIDVYECKAKNVNTSIFKTPEMPPESIKIKRTRNKNSCNDSNLKCSTIRTSSTKSKSSKTSSNTRNTRRGKKYFSFSCFGTQTGKRVTDCKRKATSNCEKLFDGLFGDRNVKDIRKSNVAICTTDTSLCANSFEDAKHRSLTSDVRKVNNKYKVSHTKINITDADGFEDLEDLPQINVADNTPRNANHFPNLDPNDMISSSLQSSVPSHFQELQRNDENVEFYEMIAEIFEKQAAAYKYLLTKSNIHVSLAQTLLTDIIGRCNQKKR